MTAWGITFRCWWRISRSSVAACRILVIFGFSMIGARGVSFVFNGSIKYTVSPSYICSKAKMG